MTKQQIIDALASKYAKVGTEAQWSVFKTIIGVDIVSVPVWEANGDSIWENNILVCKDGDTYYWRGGEPKSTAGLFGNRVADYIDSKIADGTVKFATVLNINTSNKKATVTAIMPDKSTKTVLLTESTPGTFALEVIV